MSELPTNATGLSTTRAPATRTRADLTLDRVCKSFSGPNVVDQVTFAVRAGEFVSLLGPSGSGKTTTLMLVAGFQQPDRGDVCLGERSIVYVPPQRRNFGIVFQSYSLFPHMSVLDNVAYPLRMRRLSRRDRERRAAEMLSRMSLEGLGSRLPRQLSGGQQQRVALARALVFEPGLLLLDEPLGSLDKRLRDTLQLEIRQIQQDLQVSVLHITHDQEEAMTMADQIGVMCDGKLLQLGSPEEVYNSPTSSFVANFLGETNLLPCTISGKSDDTVYLTYADGTRGASSHGRDRERDTNGPGQATASVRPEKIELHPSQHRGRSGNVAHGTLISRSFAGSYVRYTVDALGTRLIVKLTTESHPFRPGDPVIATWPAGETKLLPSDRPTT